MLYHLSYAPSPFAFSLLTFAQDALKSRPPYLLLSIRNYRHVPPYSALLVSFDSSISIILAFSKNSILFSVLIFFLYFCFVFNFIDISAHLHYFLLFLLGFLLFSSLVSQNRIMLLIKEHFSFWHKQHMLQLFF
jgi:hypothetical protein